MEPLPEDLVVKRNVNEYNKKKKKRNRENIPFSQAYWLALK